MALILRQPPMHEWAKEKRRFEAWMSFKLEAAKENKDKKGKNQVENLGES